MKRPDASMDLLNGLRDQALEPEYKTAGAPNHPGLARSGVLVASVAAGVLIAISANLSTASAPENASERTQLVSRIQAQQADQIGQRQELAELEAEVAQLRDDQLVDQSVRDELDAVEPVAGASAVTGPGIRIVVDDAPNAASNSQLVTDRDLRQLVNALWESGAEAIAINGHRLSVRTAIRSAGSAITVDYVSLMRPYTIEAIGDPKTLASDFASTSGAGWWSYLHNNYGLMFETSNAGELELAADPGLGLGAARPPEQGDEP